MTTHPDLFERPAEIQGPPALVVPGWAAAIPFEMVRDSIPWTQYRVNMYGQDLARPRLECWYNDDLTRGYTFGGGEAVMPIAMDRVVARVRLRLQEQGFGYFDSCFANRYDNGQHSIGWHADDDDWIGPVIASVSFGCSRRFNMKPKPDHPGKLTPFELGHGDLIIMKAGCQEAWQHCLPKTTKPKTCRVNLTFRTTL